jgi:hypothetical protein
VRIGLGYATRTYRLPADALGGDLAVVHGGTSAYPRVARCCSWRLAGGC